MAFQAAAVAKDTSLAAAGAAPRLELSAQTLGCRVPRTRREGRVEAVFERACNVALVGGGMITLLAQNCANNPHGVRLSCSPRLDRILPSETPVWMSRDRIVFGDTLVVTIDQAPTWTPRLQAGMLDWQAGHGDNVLLLERLLRKRVARTGSDFLAAALGVQPAATALAARVAQVLTGLSHGVHAMDADASLEAIARFVGLGPGLTPAGDDFIVGWLAGVALAARTRAQLDFLHNVCAGLGAMRGATTSFSWQHLDDARALLFSERLSELGVAIVTLAPEPVLADRVDAQLAVGASSGADAAAGLIVALLASRPELQALYQSRLA